MHRDVSSGTPLSSESHPQWMLSCLMGNTQPPVRAPPGPPPEVTVSGQRVPSSCPPPYPPPTSLSLHFLLPISEAFQRGTRAIPFPVPIPIPIPIPSPSQSLGCGPGDLEAGEVVCIPPCVIPAPPPPTPPPKMGPQTPNWRQPGQCWGHTSPQRGSGVVRVGRPHPPAALPHREWKVLTSAELGSSQGKWPPRGRTPS